LPDLNPSPETQKELDALKGRLGSGANTDAQLGAVADALGPQGEVQGDDPNDTRRALGQEAARAAKQYEGEYLSQGVDPAEAKAKARRRAKAVVGSRNPALAGDVDQYFAEVDAVAAGVPVDAGGGGGTRTSTSSRDVGFYSPRGDIGPATQAGAAAVPEVPSRQSVLDEIARAEQGIEAPEAPTVPTFDPFTRGRSLYGQRFGPTVPIPAYAERNLTRTLLDLPPEMQAQIGKSYRDYLAQQEAAAAAAAAPREPVAAAPAAPVAAPPVPAAAPEVVPPAAPAPEVAPAPAAPPAPAPEAPPVEPAEPRIAPTPAAPPAPEFVPEDPETRALRLKAQAAVRAREFAAKQAELQAMMDKRAADRGLVDGMFAGYDDIAGPQSGRMKAFMEAAPYMEMSPPPPEPGVRTLPQFTPPEQRAAPVIMPQVMTAEARKRALEMAALGMKPEGELMATPPAAPSAAMAAPKKAAKLDLKGPGPLAAKSPEDIQQETDAQITAASELSTLTKALVEDEKFRERMLRTKPGEFASKVYRANLEAKKGLNATQNTVVDEYMGNTKDMKTALAVAYALDALNKPVSPVKALTK
jgi:hypothetical protein